MRNTDNPNQGKFKKVLCVCSAGLLSSPTAAHILSAEPFNFNTRSVGAMTEYALIPLDKIHIVWADEIICFEKQHLKIIETMLEELACGAEPKITLVDCPDNFGYRDPILVTLLTDKFKEMYGFE